MGKTTRLQGQLRLSRAGVSYAPSQFLSVEKFLSQPFAALVKIEEFAVLSDLRQTDSDKVGGVRSVVLESASGLPTASNLKENPAVLLLAAQGERKSCDLHFSPMAPFVNLTPSYTPAGLRCIATTLLSEAPSESKLTRQEFRCRCSRSTLTRAGRKPLSVRPS